MYLCGHIPSSMPIPCTFITCSAVAEVVDVRRVADQGTESVAAGT